MLTRDQSCGDFGWGKLPRTDSIHIPDKGLAIVRRINKCALLVIALAVVIAPISVASADLLVRGYNPVGGVDPKYDRFANSSQFIGAGYDFSGVGQDPGGHWATLISPHFFLSAGHSHPSAGGTVTLYDTNSTGGTHNSYSVLDGFQIQIPGDQYPTDLFVGLLGTAASEASYPILDTNSLAVGQSIFVYGKTNRLGTNVIAQTGTYGLEDLSHNMISESKGYQFFYQQTGNPDDAQLQGGDSGGPSFETIGGQLVLVGTHSGAETVNFPYISQDTSPSFYIDELNAAMAQLATAHPDITGAAGEHVTVVPEPSSLILLGVAALGLACYCRRWLK
jgi:hypothetical protein